MNKEELLKQSLQDEIENWKRIGVSNEEIIKRISERYYEAVAFASKILTTRKNRSKL
jgi:hypothetical protein